MLKQQVQIHRLGLMEYQEAWDLQTELMGSLVELKRSNRERPADQQIPPVHHLLLCQHPPVYTMGKSGKDEHLLLNRGELKQNGVAFHKINRGGDITFHGPGQMVVYPIFDLEFFFTDVHKYVRMLEEAVIRTLMSVGLEGFRMKDYTGVWLGDGKSRNLRKICAIGVHLSRWVSMHGLALNVSTDLSYFERIVPCGIQEPGKSVTSLEKELGKRVEIPDLQDLLVAQFAELFDFNPIETKQSKSRTTA